MHPAIGAPDISFGKAALSAGVPEKVLRNWLDRRQITLDAETAHTSGRWRRFSVTDVVRISLMKRIVDYGFGVSEADAILCEHFDGPAFTARALAEQLPEAGVLRTQLAFLMLILCRDGRVALIRGALPHEQSFLLQSGREPQPIDVPWEAKKGSEWFLNPDAPVADFIVIRMGVVADETIKRLGCIHQPPRGQTERPSSVRRAAR